MESLKRIVAPNRYTPAPFGTLCTVERENGPVMYIQVSDHEENPSWIRLGDFFEQCFLPSLHQEGFIQKCLTIYQTRSVPDNVIDALSS